MTSAYTNLMRVSPSLKARIEARTLHADQSIQWMDRRFTKIITAGGDAWSDAWRDAQLKAAGEGDLYRDLGVNLTIITDEMIDTAIAAVIEADPEPAQQSEGTALAALQLQMQQQAAQIADLQKQVDASQPDAGETPAG